MWLHDNSSVGVQLSSAVAPPIVATQLRYWLTLSGPQSTTKSLAAYVIPGSWSSTIVTCTTFSVTRPQLSVNVYVTSNVPQSVWAGSYTPAISSSEILQRPLPPLETSNLGI